MKRTSKIFIGMIVASFAFGAGVSFAGANQGNVIKQENRANGDGCYMIQDKKTGEWKYCCPFRGCIWV